MVKDRVERQLESLRSVRLRGPSKSALTELRKALQDRVNVIVAKAATMAEEWEARELTPNLAEAFDRLLNHPEADPQCAAKNAIAKALTKLEFTESAIFLSGLRYRQWESVWGGKVDTAATLRGICAHALVQCGDLPREQILTHLVDALTEASVLEDNPVRMEAARALAQLGGRDVLLLLRLKARAGDKEPRVTGQVLECLLELDGSHAVKFVAAFLQHEDEMVSGEAAFALGASRLPEAVHALQSEFARTQGKRHSDILLRAISSSRQDSALVFLLEQIRSARLRIAEEALRAMELHKDSGDIVDRVRQAIAEREDLLRLFHERFGGAGGPTRIPNLP